MIIAVLVLAFAGGLMMFRVKAPAGGLLGAMVLVAAFGIIIGGVTVPGWFKTGVQIITGAYLGSTMTRENATSIKRLIKPALFMLSVFLIGGLGIGFTFHLISGLDLNTTFFATVPGGMSDMSIISDDWGADVGIVSVFQLARMVLTISVYPFMVPLLSKKQRQSAVVSKSKTAKPAHPVLNVAGTLAISAVFGLVGKETGFPAGTLLFAIVGVSLVKIITGFGYLPVNIRKGAQIVSGAFLGSKITMASLLIIAANWYNILVVTGSYFILCLMLAWCMYKVWKIDLVTAMFACAPAGASDMALISAELGADGPNVAILQMARLIGVIATFPTVISLILTYLV